jgi:glycerol-3-phosphate O-acyltransferase
MYLAGEVARREAVSKPLFENAYLAFADQGYLQTKNGKLELAASFATLEAVKAIEGRVATYLGEVAT